MQPHAFWQEIHPAGTFPEAPPFAGGFPARLPDGRQLRLPIRSLADGTGLASLIVNQASFPVLDALAGALAARLAPLAPEVVVGLPTLGLTLAAGVARALGLTRYVPLGTSRKFWYDEALSVPLSSITTAAARRLYLDPRMLPLLQGRRVVLVDDVISTGSSILAGVALLAAVGVQPVALGAAMLQTRRWQARLAEQDAALPGRVVGVFDTPLLRAGAEGWFPADQSSAS